MCLDVRFFLRRLYSKRCKELGSPFSPAYRLTGALRKRLVPSQNAPVASLWPCAGPGCHPSSHQQGEAGWAERSRLDNLLPACLWDAASLPVPVREKRLTELCVGVCGGIRLIPLYNDEHRVLIPSLNQSPVPKKKERKESLTVRWDNLTCLWCRAKKILKWNLICPYSA